MNRAVHASASTRRPSVGVFKFSSCDGCQLGLLDCEDELLAVAARLDLAFFPEAMSSDDQGQYDLALVEGSISTQHDIARIADIRRRSSMLVAIGACASTGGIQALRNFTVFADTAAAVYPQPELLDALADSTPLAQHVPVDLELHGCPIDRHQLLEVVAALLAGRRPVLPDHAVCVECKASGTPCVAVASGLPCLGPVTRAGCGAICPRFARGCYGCFGPKEQANARALADAWRLAGMAETEVRRRFLSINAGAAPFREHLDAAPAAPHGRREP